METLTELAELTPEECDEILGAVDGMSRWGVIAFEGGEPVGTAFLSFGLGQAFGHDTMYTGSDKFGALRLWKRAKQAAKDRGYDSVLIHIAGDDPMRSFWEGRGFKKIMDVYQGEI